MKRLCLKNRPDASRKAVLLEIGSEEYGMIKASH